MKSALQNFCRLMGLMLLVVWQPQLAAAQVRQVNVVSFEPSVSPWGIMTLESSDTQRHLRFFAGLWLTYAQNPLLATRNGATVFRYVQHQLVMDVLVSMGIWKYFELGLHLPIVPYQSGSAPQPIGRVTTDLRASAVGDLRIMPKVRFFNPRKRGFGLAFIAQFTLPSGLEDAHAGEPFVTFEPRLVLDYQFRQGALVALNLGLRLRRQVDVANLRVGHELYLGLGAEVPVYRRRLSVMAELLGAVGLSDAGTDGDAGIDEEEIPLELAFGLRYRFRAGVLVTAGASAGLTNGWGTPDFRVFIGVGYTHGDAERPPLVAGDPDGDGLVGDADHCPHLPEDKDGFQDTDGCPDPDDDQDGICDDNRVIQGLISKFRGRCIGRDRCPRRKETLNGYQDEDGCPDKGQAKVTIRNRRILMREDIYFRTGKARIRRRSYPILRTLAAVLRVNRDIKLVEVAGHTDERGSKAVNLKLSRLRAASVKRFLVKRGIAASRLVARGYGDTQPVNKDCAKQANRRKKKACWAKNRRVVFTVLKR